MNFGPAVVSYAVAKGITVVQRIAEALQEYPSSRLVATHSASTRVVLREEYGAQC